MIKMKTDWCKILGHKWAPIYLIGGIGLKKIKLIATECKRCKKGSEDLRNTIDKFDNCTTNSYNEKYYR